MSNAKRHVWGVVVGIFAIPVIAVGTSPRLQDVSSPLGPPAAITAIFIVLAVVLGLLAGSRISPLAALLPGLAMVGLAVVFHVPDVSGPLVDAGDDWVSEADRLIYGVIGGLLLGSALPPSRWRAAAPYEDEDLLSASSPGPAPEPRDRPAPQPSYPQEYQQHLPRTEADTNPYRGPNPTQTPPPGWDAPPPGQQGQPPRDAAPGPLHPLSRPHEPGNLYRRPE